MPVRRKRELEEENAALQEENEALQDRLDQILDIAAPDTEDEGGEGYDEDEDQAEEGE